MAAVAERETCLPMTGKSRIDFIHPEMNKTVKAIGGEYAFFKEVVFPYQGREVLYLIGCAVFDTTCCGAGGVCYARVPGFLKALHYKTGKDGRPVSRVSPITDIQARKEIRQAISRRETVQQVEF